MKDKENKKEKPCKYCDPENPNDHILLINQVSNHSNYYAVKFDSDSCTLNLEFTYEHEPYVSENTNICDIIRLFYCPFCGRKL